MMVGIVTDQTRRAILENDKGKLQEEIKQRQKQLGLQTMVNLKGKNELQQIQDLQQNASKIQDLMEQQRTARALQNRRRRQEQRARRHKQAPERYFKMKKQKARIQFEKRKISL